MPLSENSAGRNTKFHISIRHDKYSTLCYTSLVTTVSGVTRMFKSKAFHRFARRCGIEDDSLRKAVSLANKGLIDADLGGGVIKQRVARRGESKSGGFRTLIFFKREEKAFFVHGFAKSDQANVSQSELEQLKKLAKIVLSMTDSQLKKALESGAYLELPRS